MIADSANDEWAYHATDAVVLCLAAGAPASRSAMPRALSPYATSRPRGHEDRLGEAIVDLIAFDEGSWRWGRGAGSGGSKDGRWFVCSASAATNEALGRPVGLFSTGDLSTVGVFSAERLALWAAPAG